jgi:hypothetical protein
MGIWWSFTIAGDHRSTKRRSAVSVKSFSRSWEFPFCGTPIRDIFVIFEQLYKGI